MSILNKIQIVLCSDEPEKEIEEHKDEFCSDPIKLDLVIRVVIYCPDIFMPRNACAYTV